ncbi:hypothetical protein [Microvirga sp. VF16]|uniref:hypothetical protein n=1 Tax=Microvirga sp. VF16 TaxID=2807101 RepID=UPI00193D50B3|nr:hypothetical protein [Microvirga sp. VF16]QRM32150.1 hypothetical protein JO965_09305 [Microvirga sp. VF16]
MKALGASAGKKISPLGGFKVLAVLAIAVGFGLAAERTDAAHTGHGVAAKPAKEAVTSVVAKDVETTSSIETKSANDASCDISRKRLFVEGEGWIVRRVTTCY